MSIWHLLLLFLIILVIFGPQKLEGIGTSLGRAVRGFKKGLEGEDELSSPGPKSTTTTTVDITKKSEPGV